MNLPTPTVCQFQSGASYCTASLYLPASTQDSQATPCIILGHGFGGIRKMLTPYCEAFLQAGWAVLCFDYRNFGDSGGQERQVLRVKDQLDDWRAALAYARSLPQVDKARMAIWGSSLGGGHVLSIAAEDQDLRCAVAQVPHISGLSAFLAMGLRKALRLAPFVIMDLLRRQFSGASYDLPLLGAPGSRAIMTGDDGRAFLTATEALAPGARFDVAAASILSIAAYSPGRKVEAIQCPLLMIVAMRDGTTPAKTAISAASRIAKADVITFDVGHFDVYLASIAERAVEAQIAFLRQHLS